MTYRLCQIVCDGGYNRDQLEGLRLIAKGLRRFA